jgi:8-oxo-dGTP pyrophosphatase MutT (NUDIX family)
MQTDMCAPCGEGLINIRAGAVIVKNGKLLMAGHEGEGYLYSVTGRLRFGETAEEAVVREVWEETGVRLRVKRLAFIQENYFYGDSPSNWNKLIYELSFFYLMEVPEDFEPLTMRFREGDSTEGLYWVAPDTPLTLYPDFFRTEALSPAPGVRHYINDERNRPRERQKP